MQKRILVVILVVGAGSPGRFGQQLGRQRDICVLDTAGIPRATQPQIITFGHQGGPMNIRTATVAAAVIFTACGCGASSPTSPSASTPVATSSTPPSSSATPVSTQAQPAAVEVSLVSVIPGIPSAMATGVSAPIGSRSLRMSWTHLKTR